MKSISVIQMASSCFLDITSSISTRSCLILVVKRSDPLSFCFCSFLTFFLSFFLGFDQELSEEVFGFISNAAELRHILREKKYLLQQDPPVEVTLDQLREHLNYTAHNSQGALRYSRQWTEEELEQLAQSPVILIDHMPLNKPFGTCVDEPTIRLTSFVSLGLKKKKRLTR